MPQMQTLSNFCDDFSEGGALYPGGSGVVEDIRYALWDYDGKRPPDSQCAVKLTMTPTDGSNEGKPVVVFWSVGPASDFQPDHTGGFIMSDTRTEISGNSNWADVNKRFKNTCGLESKDFNAPGKGLLNLIGGEITLTRTEQMKRDGLDDEVDEKGQKRKKATILVPTRFKGVWEKGGGKARPATAAGPVAVPKAAAPAISNGTGSAFDVYSALKDIVTDAGGTIDTSAIGRAMLDKITAMGGVTPAVRTEAVKALAKSNIEVTAIAAGLTLDGTTLGL